MKFTLIAIFCLVTVVGHTQSILSVTTAKGVKKIISSDISEACDVDWVFSIAEKMPAYKGGIQNLTTALNENLHLKNDVNGKLFIWFTVNCKGKAFGFQVNSGINPGLDKQIVTQLENLQQWIPATQGLEIVDCEKYLNLAVENGIVRVLN